MNTNPSVAIVILSWNGKKYLEQFLPSVVKTVYPNLRIIVADNASTDDSIPFLQTHYPQVERSVLDKNYGFAEGYNQALKQVQADIYVLLNQDVETTPDFVTPVIELMLTDPRIAAAQPKLRAYNEKHMFEYAGAAGGFIDRYGFPFCRGRLFDAVEEDLGQYDTVCDIHWASGACMFVKADVYHALGGLDGDYFAHLEEIDLCWRIGNAGYRIVYCPDGMVYHVGGGSLHKSNPRKTYLNFRNSLLTLYKNTRQKLWWVFGIKYLLDGLAILFFMKQRKWGDVKAIMQAHRDFRRMLPAYHAKRQATQSAAKVKTVPGIFPHSIAWQYFVKHKSKFSQIRMPGIR